MSPTKQSGYHQTKTKVQIVYTVVVAIFVLIFLRLFYLQVIRYDYYKKQAVSGQLKQYEIPAERGIIEAHDGDKVVPIVLNQSKFVIFADPKYIKDPSDTASKVQPIIGGNKTEIEQALKSNSRYVVLAKKVDKNKSKAIDDLNILGLGSREERYRTYPQGPLAAQILGFVNDEGEGKYGVEQFLNLKLKGQAGELRAITDARGVPLVANKDNIVKAPKQGERTVLTIDVSMQKQLEDILQAGLKKVNAASGGAFIMDIHSGAIKAMANFPSYNPEEFFKTTDANDFNNATVSSPLEPGSIMKPLTMAATLNVGAVKPDQTFYDPGQWVIDGATVRNVQEVGGPGEHPISDILKKSMNTGTTWLLMQMGGGEINEKARTTWSDYMTNHYLFGKKTGIEQGYEAEGDVPDPKQGYGLNIRYANSTFGQGMTATPLQMGAALATVLNGGTYYRPHLVDYIMNESGEKTIKQPEIVKKDVVSKEVGQTVQSFMEAVVRENYRVYGMSEVKPGYTIGGKTGTAQIAKPGGGYYDDRFNGMFSGFIGGEKPEYVVIVRVNEPKVPGYAGSRGAGPIFAELSAMLLNNFNIMPKKTQ